MAYKRNCREPNGDGSGTRRSRAVLLSEVDTPRSLSSCKTTATDAPLSALQEDEREPRVAIPKRRQTSVSIQRDEAESVSETDGYAVLDIRPDGEGAFVLVVLRCPDDGEGRKAAVNSGRVTVRLLVEQYAELSPKRGALTPEQADALTCAGRLAEAVRRAVSLLQYGDSSERRLTYKLTAKGIDRADAEAAVAYLADKGMIEENRGAARRAEQNARKLWGPRRIREDLRAQGYGREAIEAAMLALEDREVDFVDSCATVIRRKWGGVSADRAARAKCRAALLRLGFESDTVREAERLILSGEA